MVDYAANLGRQLQLIGTWNGKPLEDGFKATTRKVQAATERMANKTSGLVNKKMGMSMSMFNEKTEKGRQLLTTFGGAVGGAAGNIVYYCLVTGTEVRTTRGPVEIQDIRSGDLVYAYSTRDGSVVTTRVLDRVDRGMQSVIDLVASSGKIAVSCTASHQWLTPVGVQSVGNSSATIEIIKENGCEVFTVDRSNKRFAHCWDLSIDTEDHLYILNNSMVTHNSGTLSYVVGRFSLWELAIMGTIAAIGGLIYWLAQSSEEEKKHLKNIEDITEAMKKSRDSYKEYVESIRNQMDGIDQHGKKVKEVHDILIKLRKDEADALGAYLDQSAVADRREKERLYEKVKDLRNLRKEAEHDYAERLKIQEEFYEYEMAIKIAAAKEEDDREEKRKKDKPGKAPDVDLPGFGLTAYMEAMQKQYDAVVEAEYQSIKLLHDLRSAEESEKQAILDAEFEWEKKRIRIMLELKKKEMEDGAAIEEKYNQENLEAKEKLTANGMELLSILGQSEQVSTEVRIAAIMARAAWRMYEEIAEGVSAIDRPWVAAAHFSSAALFAAIAAGEVAGAVSGGGGQSSVGARSSFQDRDSDSWKDEKRETTIVIQLGGREVGRAVHEAYESYEDRLSPNRTRKVVGY